MSEMSVVEYYFHCVSQTAVQRVKDLVSEFFARSTSDGNVCCENFLSRDTKLNWVTKGEDDLLISFCSRGANYNFAYQFNVAMFDWLIYMRLCDKVFYSEYVQGDDFLLFAVRWNEERDGLEHFCLPASLEKWMDKVGISGDDEEYDRANDIFFEYCLKLIPAFIAGDESHWRREVYFNPFFFFNPLSNEETWVPDIDVDNEEDEEDEEDGEDEDYDEEDKPAYQADDSLSEDVASQVLDGMVRLPAGSFLMGSPKGELGRWDCERQHEVTLTKEFYMGRYPVTQELWEAVMGKNPSMFTGKERPVECVSWDDAKKFCATLNELLKEKIPEGYRFDLPTEAQWEYACRAGTKTALNNGKELMSVSGECPNLDEVAWYGKNSGYETHKVGAKAPNAWGLYDMHGNVYEWCRDWYGDYPEGGVTDPEGPASGSGRVNRGGGWCNYARGCRAADRINFDPGDRDCSLGFRLALVPVQ